MAASNGLIRPAALCLPRLGEPDGLSQLLFTSLLGEFGFSGAELVEVDVVHHDPQACAHTEAVEGRREHIRILFHLEHRGAAAAQQLGRRQQTDAPAFLPGEHRGHGQIQIAACTITKIFGPSPEHRIAEVIVGAHEAGQHELGGSVDDPIDAVRTLLDHIARPDIGNPVTVDQQCPGGPDLVVGMDGDECRVADEGSHHI